MQQLSEQERVSRFYDDMALRRMVTSDESPYSMGSSNSPISEETLDRYIWEIESASRRPGGFSGGIRTMTEDSDKFMVLSCHSCESCRLVLLVQCVQRAASV